MGSVLEHIEAPSEVVEAIRDADQQSVRAIDLASVNFGVLLQAGRRLAGRIGRDMTQYFESLKADAVIGLAMEHMTHAGPEDVQGIVQVDGWEPPEVGRIVAMLEGVYREATGNHSDSNS